MKEKKKIVIHRDNWSEFKEKCKSRNLNFSTVFSYWNDHPDLTEDEVFHYYDFEKPDFKHIKELCEKEGFSYKGFLAFRRRHPDLSEEEQINLHHQNVDRQKPAFKVGDRIKNSYGLEAEIIEYKGANDIDVKFLIDGYVLKGLLVKNIQRKSFGHPIYTRSYFERKSLNEKYCGMKKIMNNGMMAEIIEYRKRNDITVRFEDNAEKITTFNQFKEGTIAHPHINTYEIIKKNAAKERIGQSAKNNDGHMMTIIEYVDSGDIDIRRDDGIKVYHRTYQNFQRGAIDFSQHDHIGEKYLATNGMWMEIIGYPDEKKHYYVNIQFEDGVIVENNQYLTVKKGQIAHPILHTQKNFKGFFGFSGGSSFNFEGKRYYKCECEKCKNKYIMTPQEMIEHEKYCNSSEE